MHLVPIVAQALLPAGSRLISTLFASGIIHLYIKFLDVSRGIV